MHEQLLDYFQKQHQHLEHYLTLCFEAPGEEVVHELRVSIKRIRAILLFTEQLSGTKKFDATRHYKPLRKLFRRAGNIRDVQVQQILVAECAITLDTSYRLFLKHLNKLEQTSTSRFFKDMEQGRIPYDLTSIQHLIKHSLSSFLKEEIAAKVMKLLVRQCKALRVKLEMVPGNEELHIMRTTIKQMRYIMGIIRKSYPEVIEFPMSPQALAQAELMLGQWHDRIVGMELLNNFRKKLRKDREPETENYNALAVFFDVDQRIFRARIRRTLMESLSA